MAKAAEELSADETQLRFQRMEAKLVTGLFDHPGIVHRETEHRLRYSIALAALETFQPGAAKQGGRTNRPEVKVETPRLKRWRELLLAELRPVLLHTSDSRERIEKAAAWLEPKLNLLDRARNEVLGRYADQFSERELDQELGIKTLVNIAGGGGGSGWVYIGAWETLQNAGLVPGYVIGSSIGAVLGLFRARRKTGDFDEYMALAKSLRPEDLFRFVSTKARFGLPGIMRFYLHIAIGSWFSKSHGRALRIPDLEIPYESVVAGVRRGALGETPEEYAQSHYLPEDRRPGPLQLRAQIASQLVRMVGFISPRVVQEIVVGGDDLTRDFNAVDAAGFSAAIPGILHYDVAYTDKNMNEIMPQLMKREDVIAIVDGGVANNVPARNAWKQVQKGKIGTRNCYYLAFDCFHPQVTMGHLWLQPLTRMVEFQVALNTRYTHRRIRFSPTLSPINLLPRADELDTAVAWGRRQMSQELPLLLKFFERVHWVPLKETKRR